MTLTLREHDAMDVASDLNAERRARHNVTAVTPGGALVRNEDRR